MRIAIAGQTWGPENGPGVFSRRLAHGLAGCEHAVTALVPARGRSQTAMDGAVAVTTISAVSLAPFYPEVRVTAAPLRSVRRALESFEPDLVHVQDHYPLSRAVVKAARERRIPIVATNHFIPGNMLPHMSVLGRLRITEAFLWRGLVAVLGMTSIVTTPTETAAAILRPRLKGVPVLAISCGVDVRAFRPPAIEERTAARARWSQRPDEVIFTFVGRLDREKRIDVLIEAIARVANRNVRLIVAGRGRHLAALQRLAAKPGVAGRITFAGFVSDADLPSLLHASDVFAMPSDVELQSIATLEAMASGLPVLAADASALPELVEEGVNGALFQPGDPAGAAEKIELLAASTARRSEMGKESRARAGRHSLEATVRAYEEVYRGL